MHVGFGERRGETCISRDTRRPAPILQVRRTSSAEAQARKALEQIREKDYMHGLKGETILYGICFDKKVPVIESERISGSRTITGVRGPARP